MKYFLDISYKGTNYKGWQIQKNGISVQEVLENALSLVLKENISTLGSGRTDTGVHAKQQYVMFETNYPVIQKNVANLNGILPKDIVVNKIYSVPELASARFDAIDRSYQYFINQKPNPFVLETSYYFYKSIDLELMNYTAQLLLKHNDFQCFSKIHTAVNNFLCKITRAEFVIENEFIVFHITANRFLRGMVRTIVGTLLEVGQGKMTVEQFQEILDSKNRKIAGRAVPSEGLYLSHVRYPENYLKLIE